MIHKTSTNIHQTHFLQALPSRDAIHFNDVQLAVTIPHEIDAGIINIHGASRRFGQALELPSNRDGLAAGALCSVGDPSRAAPDHSRPGTAIDHKYTPVIPVVLTPIDIGLQIVDAAKHFL